MSSRSKVLIIYSLDTAPTVVSAEFARHAYEVLRNSFDVSVFGPLTANNYALRFAWFFRKFDAIFYYGHGTKDALLGQLPFGAIRAMIAKYDKFIRTKLIFAVACLSAKELGPEFVRSKNTSAYVGSKYYVLVAFPDNQHNYMADFIDAFTEFPRGIAQGLSVKAAFLQMKRKMARYIQLYNTKRREWYNADFYAWAMKMNYDGFVLLGDPDVHLA